MLVNKLGVDVLLMMLRRLRFCKSFQSDNFLFNSKNFLFKICSPSYKYSC